MAKLYVTRRDGTQVELDDATGDRSVMEVMRDLDIDVEAICGGCCSCATCHVFVDDAWLAQLPERGDDETELVESTEHFHGNNSRLSCQIPFSDHLDGLKLTVAPEE